MDFCKSLKNLGDPLAWSGTNPAPSSGRYVPNLRLACCYPITPAAGINLAGGFWRGIVSFDDEADSVTLVAGEGAEMSGISNPFDVQAPFIRRVTSPHANGVFTIGELIDIDVVFTGAVALSGTPQLQLETGAIDRTASFIGAVAPDTLRFRYVVSAGDQAVRLDTLTPNSLWISGGWIRDAESGRHEANLTLPAPGTPGSLGELKNIVIDTSAPRPVLTSSAPDPTRVSPIPVTVSFSKPVSGITASDFTVSGATLNSLSGSGSLYRFELFPARQGPITVGLVAGAVQDAGGVPCEAAQPLTRTYDTVSPGFSILAASPNLARQGVTVKISSAATEVLQSSPTLTVNGHDALLRTHNGLTYAYDYQVGDEAFEGGATILIKGVDYAGNVGQLKNTSLLRIDTLAPSCTISGPVSPTTQTQITFTLNFRETLKGAPDRSKIVVSGGAYGALSSRGDGKTFTLAAMPAAGRGEVACQALAGAGHDLVGNPSVASNRAVTLFDPDGVSVQIMRYLLGLGGGNLGSMDLNKDGWVTVADLVWETRNGPPPPPSGPSPADGTFKISLGSTLDWADCPRATTYQIYLWKASQVQPATPSATGLTASQWKPATALAANTTYRWFVVAINGSQKRQGPTWTFTTI